MEDLEDQVACSSKQGNPRGTHVNNGHGSEANSASYPRSCVTTSLTYNMLDFSSRMLEKRHGQPYHSSKGNSTVNGAALKKAKLQPFSSSQSSFKVRKEKLGDRITALHQLVSPFGKTDTASVLLEAIGYINSLHSQIEALSSSGSRRQQDIGDKSNYDLRSQGLCLIPVSCIFHRSDDNCGVDHRTPSPLGGNPP